jgi:hypothetical protein
MPALGTYEFVSSVGGTLTVTVRKRNRVAL